MIVNIGQGIKKVIKQKGKTQKEVALSAGISEKALSQIVKGHVQPRKKTLEMIAYELDVDPVEFVELPVRKIIVKESCIVRAGNEVVIIGFPEGSKIRTH